MPNNHNGGPVFTDAINNTLQKVKVGCCSVDVLKQLINADTPVDLPLAPEALQMPSVPDIFIVPSDLTHLVKVLSLEGTSEGGELDAVKGRATTISGNDRRLYNTLQGSLEGKQAQSTL
ncbi:unnamed protein product [Lactuca virosa]|uniref:Uncharacterized protein n=1 Tax=Lactuca virosa TaxID=75947 RepID=A0AAU9M5E4_9ASTR|nr:unnamed protein product [Lactuca virosa]